MFYRSVFSKSNACWCAFLLAFLSGYAAEGATEGATAKRAMDPSAPVSVTYSQEQLARFSASVVENPIAIGENPYLDFTDSGDSRLIPRENVVCGIQIASENPLHYRLATYGTASEAKAAGASVTHFSACGSCSTLQDLSVYLARPDLTTPVRRCALLGFSKALAVSCLKDLGFTQSCSETWYYKRQAYC